MSIAFKFVTNTLDPHVMCVCRVCMLIIDGCSLYIEQQYVFVFDKLMLIL